MRPAVLCAQLRATRGAHHTLGLARARFGAAPMSCTAALVLPSTARRGAWCFCTAWSAGCQEFTTFYEQRTSHRRLRWVHNLGTAVRPASAPRRPASAPRRPASAPRRPASAQVLNGSFDKSKHELTVSTYQACILLLFNAQVCCNTPLHVAAWACAAMPRHATPCHASRGGAVQ